MTQNIRPRHADCIISKLTVSITLPTVPGITITRDRDETTPTMPTIRVDGYIPKLRGVAAKQAALWRVEMFRTACREIISEGNGL